MVLDSLTTPQQAKAKTAAASERLATLLAASASDEVIMKDTTLLECLEGLREGKMSREPE